MSRIKKGSMALGVAAVAALLSLSAVAPANATDTDGVTDVNVSVECVEGAPVATVNVAYTLPEGSAGVTLGVYIGGDLAPLEPGNPTRDVTQSGSFDFTGSVPVGETYFMVGDGGIAYEGTIVAESCDPDLVPPTFTGMTVEAGCIEGNPDAEVLATVSLDIPENAAEFTIGVVGPDGVGLNLAGFDGGVYYFSGFGSPGSQTYTAVLSGQSVGSKVVEVPSCATEPEPEPQPNPEPKPEQPTTPEQPVNTSVQPAKPAAPAAPIVNTDLPAPNTSSEDASAASAYGINPVGVSLVGLSVLAALGIGVYLLAPVIRRRLSTMRGGE